MVDLHCHILPGLDDGSRNLEMSLEMARIAAADGITEIVATPHTADGIYDNPRREVLAAVHALQQKVDEAAISLRIRPGAEVHLHHRLLEHVRTGTVQTIADQGRHLLLELPRHSPISFVENVLQDLLAAGITPVIAHPERCDMLRDGFDRMRRWRDRHILFQVNAGSLLGHLGGKTQRVAYQMLRHGLVHVLASDGHDTGVRKPSLKEAYLHVEKHLSREASLQLQWNAQAVMRGEACLNLEPRFGFRLFPVCRFLYRRP